MFKSGSIGIDFDQTLADSKKGIFRCLKKLCIDYDICASDYELKKLAVSGLSLDSILRKLRKSENIEDLKLMFMELYPSIGVPGTRLLAGAKDLVDYLNRNGHTLILISAKNQINLELSVEHLELKFDAIFGGISGEEKAKTMIENRTYLYIGDQYSDVSAAVSAQALAVLVRDKPLSLDLNIHPHLYFKNLVELLEVMPDLIKT